MNARIDPKKLINPFAISRAPSLAAVMSAVETSALSDIRKRDLRSALRRVAAFLKADLQDIEADVPSLRERLAQVHPAAVGITQKRLSTIRSDFFAAIELAGVRVMRSGKVDLSPEWRDLLALVGKFTNYGLTRFAAFCNANGISPTLVTDEVLDGFNDAALKHSFAKKAREFHRQVATLWNRVVEQRPELGLSQLTPPQYRRPPARVSLDNLPASFQQDLAAHMSWAACEDIFAENARRRPLSRGSCLLRHSQIQTAITALVRSGTPAENVCSLADLVAPAAVKPILRQRTGGRAENATQTDRDLAKTLTAIAKEWVGADNKHLDELRRVLRHLGRDRTGLTEKNVRLLSKFDDPDVLNRLYDLSKQLLREAESEPISEKSVAKAQAAIAIDIAMYSALRSANIARLKFGEDIFVPDSDEAETTIEIPAYRMKARDPFGSGLPPRVTKRIRRYRDLILRPWMKREQTWVFDNGQGHPKLASTVSWLVQRFIQRRLGFKMTLHQFRHLAAKIRLEDDPGAHESVRELLGHKNMKTTTTFYRSLDGRAAARLHAENLRKRAHDAEPPRKSKDTSRRRRQKEEYP